MIRSAPPGLPASPSWDPPSERGPVAREARGGEVFIASWCRSVGATWTVELRSVDEAALGRPLEWICSGVPTQQPTPDRQTASLLRERNLLLYPVDPIEPMPPTRSRRLIGYVTRDAEVMQLAHSLAEIVPAGRDHPMVLAARWIQAGYPADVAVRWVTAGVHWPKAVQPLMSTRPSLRSATRARQ